MDLALGTVAEALAAEFGDLCSTTVVAVLNDCVDEYPYDGSHFIEQAARARLSLLRRPQRLWPAMSGGDSLDVSLHDGELADEVELTVRLIVAANEVEDRIPPEVVDEILGVTRPVGRTIPQQVSLRL